MVAEIAAAVLFATLSAPTRSGDPQPDESFEAAAWFHEAFGVAPDAPFTGPRLHIETAYDLVQRNGHMGRPLCMRGATYARGIYCHAPTTLRAELGAPARAFRATVGVDDNPQTQMGQSSVRFAVSAGDAELYRSPVLRHGSAPLAIDVPLDGAEAVRLTVDDAGDGIHSDQAVWADAWFELEDGARIALDDLPLRETSLAPRATGLPFSFVYDGRASAELLPTWERRDTRETLDADRTRHTLSWRDPDTGLVVRCVATAYTDYPVCEWTVYLRNDGAADTPLVADLLGLDAAFVRHALLPEYEFRLHRNRGTVVTTISVPEGKRDWEPISSELEPGSDLAISPPQGRPSAGEWPYFAVESMGSGIIFAVGWPGRWAAGFERDEANGLRVAAGQATTQFTLRPGEEVRTPLIALQFWRGEREHAQNVWRRWMRTHVMPRPGGAPIGPMSGAFCGYYFPELQISEAGELEYMARYVEERLIPDYWWIDAGWFPGKGTWVNTGTWEPDPDRFPNGLRAVTDAARGHGMKSIVWFEPERVTPGSRLFEERPEWLLPAGETVEGTCLLDLGNPEARVWLTDHIDRMLREEGIDLYRQDFNMDPLPCWEARDAADRRGITENLYVQGYLAFWDELLARHPGLIIDTCASGAHRDDLETLRRSVPLWRSDWAWEPLSMQSQTFGLASWVPYFGTGAVSDDPYTMRSNMTPFFLMSWDMRRDDLDYDRLRRAFADWKRIAPYYLGDFHPLTPYSLGEDVWMAWQFHRPDLDAGLVQVFRRRDSIYESARLPLAGLDVETTYRVTNLDAPGDAHVLTGRELTEQGLPVVAPDRPSALLFVYEALPTAP